MTELERAYRHLQTLTFPSVPDDEGLAHVIELMSELDATLTRLAASAGRGAKVSSDDVPVIRGVVNRLNDIGELPEDDADIYVATVKYLEGLASLRDALLTG
jgi:hypothetical protein